MAEQHERVVDPQPPLPGQVAQIVHALVAELIARPFGGNHGRVGRAVGEPRERGGVVAVGHGQVRVAADHEGAGALELTHEIHRSGRIRAVEDQVAADRDVIGARGIHRLAHLLEGRQVAVDVAQSGDADHQRSALSGAMMKLRRASQATSPLTVATPLPRPNLLPSRSIVTSRRS